MLIKWNNIFCYIKRFLGVSLRPTHVMQLVVQYGLPEKLFFSKTYSVLKTLCFEYLVGTLNLVSIGAINCVFCIAHISPECAIKSANTNIKPVHFSSIHFLCI